MSLQPGSTNVLVIEHVEQAQFFSSLVAMMTLGPDTLSCLCDIQIVLERSPKLWAACCRACWEEKTSMLCTYTKTICCQQ